MPVRFRQQDLRPFLSFERTPERTIRKRQHLKLLNTWIGAQDWAIPGSCWDEVPDSNTGDIMLAYRCCQNVIDRACRDSKSMMQDMFGYRLGQKKWRRLYTWYLLSLDLSL